MTSVRPVVTSRVQGARSLVKLAKVVAEHHGWQGVERPIHKQQSGPSCDGAGHHQAAALAGGEGSPADLQDRVESLGMPENFVKKPDGLQGLANVQGTDVRSIQMHVFVNAALEDLDRTGHCQMLAQGIRTEFAQVDTIQLHVPGGGRTHSAEQIDERALAGARWSGDRHGLARLNVQVQIPHGCLGGVGVSDTAHVDVGRRVVSADGTVCREVPSAGQTNAPVCSPRPTGRRNSRGVFQSWRTSRQSPSRSTRLRPAGRASIHPG